MKAKERLAWERVKGALAGARAIAWDGCHKIYLLMDDQQFQEYRGYGLVMVEDRDEALATLKDWFKSSCHLRFISAVKTVEGDPNDGYTDLISRFELQED